MQAAAASVVAHSLEQHERPGVVGEAGGVLNLCLCDVGHPLRAEVLSSPASDHSVVVGTLVIVPAKEVGVGGQPVGRRRGRQLRAGVTAGRQAGRPRGNATAPINSLDVGGLDRERVLLVGKPHVRVADDVEGRHQLGARIVERGNGRAGARGGRIGGGGGHDGGPGGGGVDRPIRGEGGVLRGIGWVGWWGWGVWGGGAGKKAAWATPPRCVGQRAGRGRGRRQKPCQTRRRGTRASPRRVPRVRARC